jgi:1,4-dihydroxy-2-naphthoyl-CoA synthase
VAIAMIKFEYYSDKYSCVKMERREGILQMTLHTKGVDLKCGISAHEELSYAFYDVARDHESRCVILTGAGRSFCAEFEGGGGPGGINITASGKPQPAGLKSSALDHIYPGAKYLR